MKSPKKNQAHKLGLAFFVPVNAYKLTSFRTVRKSTENCPVRASENSSENDRLKKDENQENQKEKIKRQKDKRTKERKSERRNKYGPEKRKIISRTKNASKVPGRIVPINIPAPASLRYRRKTAGRQINSGKIKKKERKIHGITQHP